MSHDLIPHLASIGLNLQISTQLHVSLPTMCISIIHMDKRAYACLMTVSDTLLSKGQGLHIDVCLWTARKPE